MYSTQMTSLALRWGLMVMPNLFGLNIAKIIDDAIVGAGGVLTGTFHKRADGTRTPGELTSGVNPTFTDYPCRGFIELKTNRRQDGTLIEDEGERITLLGNSFPVVPEQGDEVTMEGTRWTIVKVYKRDPAAATYELLVAN